MTSIQTCERNGIAHVTAKVSTLPQTGVSKRKDQEVGTWYFKQLAAQTLHLNTYATSTQLHDLGWEGYDLQNERQVLGGNLAVTYALICRVWSKTLPLLWPPRLK